MFLLVSKFKMIGMLLNVVHGQVGPVHKSLQKHITVKSRIELNKRLHYTALVPLIVFLLVRSPLSYMQIKSLFS